MSPVCPHSRRPATSSIGGGANLSCMQPTIRMPIDLDPPQRIDTVLTLHFPGRRVRALVAWLDDEHAYLVPIRSPTLVAWP